jgi:hypothetical protein
VSSFHYITQRQVRLSHLPALTFCDTDRLNSSAHLPRCPAGPSACILYFASCTQGHPSSFPRFTDNLAILLPPVDTFARRTSSLLLTIASFERLACAHRSLMPTGGRDFTTAGDNALLTPVSRSGCVAHHQHHHQRELFAVRLI